MRPGNCHGAGLGLRPAHLVKVCRAQPAVPWFEVHICNFLGGGLNRALLHQVADSYPLSFHGVNLNLGGTDPLNEQYLGKLRTAVDEFQPDLVSEHACFTAHDGLHFHDLLPLPYTWEAVEHLASRIRQVQDYLRRPILIENISRYCAYPESELSEGEFLSAVCRQSGCALLLDLNNAYVNQCNLGLDLMEFIQSLPLERVQEVHLGGYSRQGELLIDSHGCAPCPAVWDYFAAFCELKPDVPCLIEWDNALPPLAELMGLQARASKIMGDSGNQIRANQSKAECSVNCPGLPRYALSLQAFSDLVTGGDEAVAPYTANFLGGQMGALQTNFQCVYEALGATTFTALAKAYSVHYPSREWDLNLFGAGFPELLLAQHNNTRAANCDWRLLAAIARVEYSIAAAYYADDPHGAASAGVDCGEHAIASLLAADAALPTPWNSAAMQRLNPFADIPGTLVFNREIAIYRQGLRVRICQAGSDPARERGSADAS